MKFWMIYLMIACTMGCHQIVNKKEKKEKEDSPFSVRIMPEKYLENHDNAYTYFLVRIEKPGFTPDEKTSRYIDFEMEKDFKIVTLKDTISPSIYQRINSGIASRYELMLAFEKQLINTNEGETSLFYEDKVFGLFRQTFIITKGS